MNDNTLSGSKTRTQKALSLAADFARELGHARIGPEHVLVGLMREKMGPGAQILHHHGVTEEAAAAAIRRICEAGSA